MSFLVPTDDRFFLLLPKRLENPSAIPVPTSEKKSPAADTAEVTPEQALFRMLPGASITFLTAPSFSSRSLSCL